MEISFATKALEKQANDIAQCKRKMGENRAIAFQKRLGALRAAATLEELRFMPGRFHELTGKRKGQYACDLDGPYRLIFEPQEGLAPLHNHDALGWNAITAVHIVEIVDYHGK